MIQPWLFEFFPERARREGEPARPELSDYFHRYLELWTAAERRGFEGIFFSEHHFSRSYSPSPHLLIAALAPRTTRLRLGVLGTVLPYYHPARVVEELGMLDHFCGGRLEIGTALGVPQELSKLGLSPAQARERYEETLDVLDAALAGEAVSHRGRHYEIPSLRLLPGLRPRPRPSVWTAVMGAEGARRAARRGYRICTGFSSVATVKSVFDAYRDECQAAGAPSAPEHLALRRRVSLGTSTEEAQAAARAAADRLRGYLAEDERFGPRVPDAPQAGTMAISEEEFITGTPSQVAEAIVAQCRAVGAGHFLSVLHWSAPIEEVERAHELYAREVIPQLRRAGV